MNILFILLMAESFFFAVVWHNQSPRPGKKNGKGRPDPAVLFSRKSAKLRKQTASAADNAIHAGSELPDV
jgi:hypothetical protein